VRPEMETETGKDCNLGLAHRFPGALELPVGHARGVLDHVEVGAPERPERRHVDDARKHLARNHEQECGMRQRSLAPDARNERRDMQRSQGERRQSRTARPACGTNQFHQTWIRVMQRLWTRFEITVASRT
jgi:hypothetical protein